MRFLSCFGAFLLFVVPWDFLHFLSLGVVQAKGVIP